MLSLPFSHAGVLLNILHLLPELSTDIIYSFADIDPGSGAISLSNLHTDTQVGFSLIPS